jgi:hypothetical protein
MGYTHRNDEIRDNIKRMRRKWQEQREALAAVRQFNAAQSAGRRPWTWPKIAAAITARHLWRATACGSCGTVIDLDLPMKPRDPEAFDPRRASRRPVPALQRRRASAHRRAVASPVDLTA